MTYTDAVGAGVAGACLVDLVVLRTCPLRRKAFWTSYAIIAFFQLIVNGLLTGLRIVRYDPAQILGPPIRYAPVEDLGSGVAMVPLTLSLWVWWGRHGTRSVHEAPKTRRSRPVRTGPPASSSGACAARRAEPGSPPEPG